MKFSIRTKLVLAIGLPLLAAYLGMAWCEYTLGRREALANMESHLSELAARWAAELDQDLDVSAALARTAAVFVAALPDPVSERIHPLVQETLRDNPKVYGMCIAFEPEGTSRDTVPLAAYWCRDSRAGLRYVDVAAKMPNYAGLDWYRPAKTGGRPFWTEPYFDTGIGERIMCTYTAPVFRNGRFRGVVTVDVLSEDLLEQLARMRVGSGYCTLISRRGTFISHPDPSLIMRESIFSLAKQHGMSELADTGGQMVAGNSGVQRICDYRTGRPEWMVYAPVESAGWSLAAVLPEEEVLAPIYARLVRSLAILGAGLAVILAVVLLVSVRVARPIGRLAAAAESLGRGDLDVRVPEVPGGDEVAQLARRFNAMVADLKRNIDGRIREETARREVEGELRAAREIQASLLPGMLPPEQEKGFALHAVNAPARLVAGDFYDFFFLDDRRLVLVMADVSGKGVPAAMYMAVARTKLRDFAAPQKTPAQIVTEVNRCLGAENDHGMFVSLFFGCYDVCTGELVYVNAGHNPPYLVRRTGHLEPLDPTGPLVAPFPDAVFREARCKLEEEDLLVLFTDGVTEAGLKGSELFGEERLERLLLSELASPVAEVCRNVIRAASDFSRGDLPDDASVLALRRTRRA